MTDLVLPEAVSCLRMGAESRHPSCSVFMVIKYVWDVRLGTAGWVCKQIARLFYFSIKILGLMNAVTVARVIFIGFFLITVRVT